MKIFKVSECVIKWSSEWFDGMGDILYAIASVGGIETDNVGWCYRAVKAVIKMEQRHMPKHVKKSFEALLRRIEKELDKENEDGNKN